MPEVVVLGAAIANGEGPDARCANNDNNRQKYQIGVQLCVCVCVKKKKHTLNALWATAVSKRV